ncbi:NADH:ubiquinone reductase (Na(+)-transporting) subunit F [Limimaricola pyoseonensis]|uniref:Na(+)-translocating NADH-quinone reductase subunit F n=1 Tax=Limimaricola pyoseonensis TaxID=521013 RepID=A0A1G7JM34_9RHOB|nr:NADH:ubiquinone reductase (Na(+)-transporting) subunit F [Limimaricola pyoseonensis]SDF25915.1 Na+-transporting NADH:ubiquinone oxidoreductase subunit F [Limimaricola pyoseonensis]
MSALAGALLLTALLLALSTAVLLARRLLVPQRAVRVSVEGGPGFEASTGETLLAALEQEGIDLPAACGGTGTCGLCRLRVTEGGADPLPTETARLSRAELREGAHLACQVVLRGDLTVALPEGLAPVARLDAVVAATRMPSPLIREIELALPEGEALDCEAGAFVQVTAPPFALDFAEIAVPDRHTEAWRGLRGLRVSTDVPVTRAYSVAGRPEDAAAGRIVLMIRLALPPPGLPGVPPGVVSSWLISRRVGDRVALSGPHGGFRARESGREMVFVGGGVGLAPLRAIIHDRLTRAGDRRQMSFFYGARGPGDLLHADEFEALEQGHPNFCYTPVLSEPEAGWAGPAGFVHEALRDRFLMDHPAPERCDYYLCGPPLMTAAVRMLLEEAGVPPGQVFSDDFGV